MALEGKVRASDDGNESDQVEKAVLIKQAFRGQSRLARHAPCGGLKALDDQIG
jgi:hypothetical protein